MAPSITGWSQPAKKKTPGIDGAIMLHENHFPPTVLVVDVDDIDPVLEKVKQSGGEIILPKEPHPGYGLFGLFQRPAGRDNGYLPNRQNSYILTQRHSRIGFAGVVFKLRLSQPPE